MHRQPDRGLLRRRPSYPVLRVGRDVEVVAGAELDCLTLEFDPGSPLEHNHPLAGWLVVPEAIGGLVAVRDDSLNADIGGLQERREEFRG